MEERLQKIISRAGLASRRAGEEIILAGRVRVNGRVVTELGIKADLGRDTIEVDGKRLVHEASRYLVLHKPRGVVSTLSDPEGRPTVAGLLEGEGARLYPVGRLDFATSGVLLVTNDGDFANGMLHPRGGVPKTYVVKTKGTMTDEDLERWRTGVQLEDGKTLPAEVRFLRHEEDKTWFEVTLREGRNQQIRRMGEATGFPVMRLARTSFAGISSEGLRPGQYRSLTIDELLALRQQYGVPRKIRGAALTAAHEGAGPARRPRSPRGAHPAGARTASALRSREGHPASRAPERKGPRDERTPPRDERRPPRDERRPPRDEQQRQARDARRPPRDEQPRQARDARRPPHDEQQGQPRDARRPPRDERRPPREERRPPREERAAAPRGTAPRPRKAPVHREATAPSGRPRTGRGR